MAHSRQLLTLKLLMFTVFIVIFSADGQITFSRDWKNGKRAGVVDCLDTFPPPVALCHTLISELRAAATCEAKRLLRHQDSRVPRDPGLYPRDASGDDKR